MAEERIRSLMEKMESSKLIIPSFQRDYVWKKEQIEALFDSLMRKIPINSLLIWKLNGKYIREQITFDFYKFFCDYNSERTDNEKTSVTRDDYEAVIDGQQRLTSIYIGFHGSYSERKPYARKAANTDNMITRRLYLCLTEPETEDSLPEDNLYVFKFLSKDEIGKLTEGVEESVTPAHEATIFIDKQGRRWLLVPRVPTIDEDMLVELESEYCLSIYGRKTLRRIWDLYHGESGRIHVIEWEKADINEAITVFVRYNSKGTVLTPAQVIQSVLAVYWPNIREDIKQLRKQVKKHGFEIDVNFIIKALLTAYTNDPKNDIKAITFEVADKFQREWKNFFNAVSEMFGELKKLGYSHDLKISYNATLPILVYILHPKKVLNPEQDWKRIGMWLAKTLLLESFSNNSDTAIRNAIKPIKKAGVLTDFPADDISEALQSSNKNIDIDDLLNMQYNDKRARLLLSVLLPSAWNIKAELDHLHPISQFKKNSPEYERANSIVNLQPLRGVTNAVKKNAALDIWVSQVFATPADRQNYFNAVGIPASTSLDFNDRDALWSARESLLKTILHQIF